MELRSLFGKIFGTEKSKVLKQEKITMVDGYSAIWSRFDDNLYNTTDIRVCIDTIARNGAKLNPKHVRSSSRGFENLNKNIQRLIAEQPNELDNAYSFYYKVISQLYLNNNAFIYISRDSNGMPIGLYPILNDRRKVKVLEYMGDIYIQFSFRDGRLYTASLRDDVILLKRFYCEGDVLGDNNEALTKVMSLKHVVKEGIINAIKTTASLKGYLKTSKAMLKPEDTKRIRNEFVNDFIRSSDGSGIAGLDATTDFHPLNMSPVTATDAQMKMISDEIKNYFGLCDEIIQSKYTEDQWNAFYESVIEPIALQMSLEFSNKLFTLRERQFGNRIVFESNRLQYASNATKVNIARYMNNYMTVNEIREIFNLAPVEDGDKILQDLNHIDSEIANDYQGGNNE